MSSPGSVNKYPIENPEGSDIKNFRKKLDEMRKKFSVAMGGPVLPSTYSQ